jgi:hypothetical protein
MACGPSPVFHAWGLGHLSLAMVMGSTVVLRRRFDPKQVLADIEEHRATALVVVPVRDRAESTPLAEVVGHGERRPRAEGAVGDIGHHVEPEARHPGHPGILCPRARRPLLPSVGGFEHDPSAFHAHRLATFDHHPSQPDPGHVPGGDHARQQVELPVRTSPRGRVEHTLDLERISRLWLHEHPETGECIGDEVNGHGGPSVGVGSRAGVDHGRGAVRAPRWV